MSATFEAPQPSRFAATLLDILDTVSYARVEPQDTRDPVYHLRYEAYHREDYLPFNPTGIYTDELDLTPNASCYGVYIGDKLVSSLRLHHITPDARQSPSMTVYDDVLTPLLDRGMTFIDPTRFTADREASLAFPALPYLTLRLALMASQHYAVDYCLSSVRPEHTGFYRRVFLCEELGPLRSYSSLNFEIVMMATYVPVTVPRIVERYPFFKSTQEERRKLFGPAGRVGFGEKVPTTAKLAQDMRQPPVTEPA